MLSTIQLLIALGLDRTALVADLVVTAVAGGVVAVVVTRAGRRRPPVPAADSDATGVVAEAEAVVDEAGRRQPA